MPTELPKRIYDLRDQKLTVREICRRLHCSPVTIKYHLRKRSDYESLQFTKKLQEAAAVAPNEFCKSEVQVCIDRIRKTKSSRYEIIYPAVLKLANEQCKYSIDFQQELSLSERQIKNVLKEMVREGLLLAYQEDQKTKVEYLTKDNYQKREAARIEPFANHIYELLCKEGGKTVKELAEMTGKHKRTIYNGLNRFFEEKTSLIFVKKSTEKWQPFRYFARIKKSDINTNDANNYNHSYTDQKTKT